MPMNKETLNKRLDDIIRMRSILHPKDWKDESQLMMKRWFDYRFMSSLEATLLFGRHYIAGLRRHVRRHIDADRAEAVSGIKNGLPGARATWFTALWRARARTDAIFVPYDLLIDFSFDFSSRRKRYWTMLPHQLHASPKNGEAWWGVFHERIEDLLPPRMSGVAEIPQYRIENDVDLPPQKHFRALTMSEIRHEHKTLADQIADKVFVKRHLTLDQGLGLAAPDTDLVELERRAKALADHRAWEMTPVVKLDLADLLPSCFGIAETINEMRAPCDTCTLANQCRAAAAEVIDTMVRTVGSASPVQDADRKRGRLATKKCRNREDASPNTLANAC